MQIHLDTADLVGDTGLRDATALIVLLNNVSPGALSAALRFVDAAERGTTHVTYTGPVGVETLASLRAAMTDAAGTPPPFLVDDSAEIVDAVAAFGAPDPLGGAGLAPPAVPGAPPATPPQSEVVDNNGFPWDPRIHAKTANGGGSINKSDGYWRAKKGVGDDVVAAVQAELRAQGYEPPPLAPVVGVPAPPVTPPPPPAQTSDSAPLAPTDTPAPPVSSPAPSPMALFQALMKKVPPAQNAGHLTVVEINGMCETVGIKQLGDLIAQPQHIPTIEAQVDAVIAASGGA